MSRVLVAWKFTSVSVNLWAYFHGPNLPDLIPDTPER